MKIQPPPYIANLEGLLDLCLHPDKLAGYLTQLKQMQEAIQEKLGVVETQEKVDQLLADAQAKREEVLEMARDAEELLERAREDASGIRAAMRQEQESWRMVQESQRHDLEAREKAVREREQRVAQESQDVQAREHQVQSAQAAATARKAALDAEFEKMMKRKELLNAI